MSIQVKNILLYLFSHAMFLGFLCGNGLFAADGHLGEREKAQVKPLKEHMDYVPDEVKLNEIIDQYDTAYYWEGNKTFLFPKGSTSFIKSPFEGNDFQRFVIYDVGSSAIKLKIADVEIGTGDHYIISDVRISTVYGVDKYNLRERVATMGAIKHMVEEELSVQKGDIEYLAVATCGFRAAPRYRDTLVTRTLNMTGIYIEVIDQATEGMLAFRGAMLNEPGADPSHSIVWDLGGRTAQIVAAELSGSFFIAVGNVGADFFLIGLKDYFNSQGIVSSERFTQEELDAGLRFFDLLMEGTDFTHGEPIFEPDDLIFIKSKIAQHYDIYAVGGLHNFVIQSYVNAWNKASDAHIYTDQDLENLLHWAAGKTGSEINEGLGLNTKRPKEDMLKVVLVLGLMKTLGIHEVTTVNVNNADGVLAEQIEMNKNLSTTH